MDYKKLVNCLKEKILASSNVYITGHTIIDIDALASSVGLYNIVESLGKNACIVVDDSPLLMDPGAKKILDNVGMYTEICSKDDVIVDENSLLIMADVNQYKRISVNGSLFNDIIVIDHHAQNADTIPTPNLFIDITASSTCEIVSKLLANFNILLSHQKIYTYLYAGIILDTKKFTQNTRAATFAAATYLAEKGANINLANSLLLQDFASDRRMQRLVGFADIKNPKISATMDRDNPFDIYTHNEIASAADYLLSFDSDMAFAMAYVQENIVALKGRSKGNLDVGKILTSFGGGGNPCAGAALISSSNILEVYDDLDSLLNFDFSNNLKYIRKLK